jgi:hypothetical protein
MLARNRSHGIASLTKELLRRELFATQEQARLRSFCRIPHLELLGSQAPL